MKTYYIYTLTNPNNNEVFYVGVTINPESRQLGHTIKERGFKKYSPKYGQHPKVNYILHHKITPVLDVIDQGEFETLYEAEKLEQYWIQQFKAWGFPITNFRGANRKRKSYLYAPYAKRYVEPAKFEIIKYDPWMNIPEAAARFGYSKGAISRAIEKGEMTYVQYFPHSRRMLKASWIREWANKKTA